MKNSKEYSKKITALYQSLKRKNTKVFQVETTQTVVDSLIYGIISEKLTEKETEAAISKFKGYFVDWNDLRVSKIEEIAELLGCDNAENRQAALNLTKVLNNIYTENNQVNLESIHKLGKRPARQKLEKMEGLSRYTIDYCMLTALDSHAIPLTDIMVEYLQKNDLVDSHADAGTIEGFLSKQISAKNGYEFYKLLRHESETGEPRRIHRHAPNVVHDIKETAAVSVDSDVTGAAKTVEKVKKTKKVEKVKKSKAEPAAKKTKKKKR